MNVRNVMSEPLVSCTPDTGLREVARSMAQHDCGQIPVIDGASRKPLGVVTDRDIVCRALAEGRDPLEMTARDVMTSPVLTVLDSAPIEECCLTMEQSQVRRVPVVDATGACVGIVSQADIARATPANVSGRVVKEVSKETSTVRAE